jgi:predicted transposase
VCELQVHDEGKSGRAQPAPAVLPFASYCGIPPHMKLVAQAKLQPTPEQHALLLKTLQQANAACNAISDTAWQHQTFGRTPLHHLTYQDMRDAFSLAAQVVVRAIGKVVDAYKLDPQCPRRFRPTGAFPFDDRILSWKPWQRTSLCQRCEPPYQQAAGGEG